MAREGKEQGFVRAASLDRVKEEGALAVDLQGRRVALFHHGGRVYAVDNRCPHMGFPLERGTLRDGILTCHWHHARFDLASGGTFDLWADDVPSFPVQVRDGEVWVDLTLPWDPADHHRRRLQEGLEHNLSLVIGKAVINLLEATDPMEPFRIGLDHGTRYYYAGRTGGWADGLTMLVCLSNLLPRLAKEDRPRALYQGLAAVARNTDGAPPRERVGPLPGPGPDVPTLRRWFRQFVEVRDPEGAERCVASAVQSGADTRQIADLLFAASTDHRYIDIGHPLDFTNKALEALDLAGWEMAAQVLTSLASTYANARRMEESLAWRSPEDLVALLEDAFQELPEAVEEGARHRDGWEEDPELVPILLGENPQTIAERLLEALHAGTPPDALAGRVAYAAALRIARFPTTNEYGDWDTALHTFTFANAVHQGLRRVASPELVRGIFDAAMSVYLDRFLNRPAVPLPEPQGGGASNAHLRKLRGLLNEQQRVNEAGEAVAAYLAADGDPDRLLATLGHLLLREDRYFHSIQMVEAAFRQYALLRGTDAGIHVLVAAARFLAAHAPTARAQGQTYDIAWRFHRGEKLYEG